MWKCVLIAFFVSQLAVLVAPVYTPIDYLTYIEVPNSNLPNTHDPRCALALRRFETVDLQGVICGQTELDVEVWKGVCLNGGSKCATHDYAFTCFETESYCIPRTTNTVIQTVTVTGPNNCQQNIQIRFQNITECRCETKTTSRSC